MAELFMRSLPDSANLCHPTNGEQGLTKHIFTHTESKQAVFQRQRLLPLFGMCLDFIDKRGTVCPENTPEKNANAILEKAVDILARELFSLDYAVVEIG